MVLPSRWGKDRPSTAPRGKADLDALNVSFQTGSARRNLASLGSKVIHCIWGPHLPSNPADERSTRSLCGNAPKRISGKCDQCSADKYEKRIEVTASGCAHWPRPPEGGQP